MSSMCSATESSAGSADESPARLRFKNAVSVVIESSDFRLRPLSS